MPARRILTNRAHAANGDRVHIATLEGLENRSLFSTLLFQDGLSGLGISQVVAENGPPLPPPGVVYERYGHGAIALGDLDGDGSGDYAVSAPGSAGVAGVVFVRSGFTGDILHTLSDGFTDFGVSLTRLGDINNDGDEDFAVGSPRHDGNLNAAVDPAGRVIVYSGADASVLRTLDGAEAFDEFGAAIAAVEDRDDDGIADLLVGAPGVGFDDHGQASVFSTLGFSVIWTYEGAQPSERVGTSVAAARTEGSPIAIGAPGFGESAGMVRVFTAAGELLFERGGSATADLYGTSMAFLAGAPGQAGTTLILAVGIPGADSVLAADPSSPYSGASADRGAVEAILVATGESIGFYGGVRSVNARFGSVVAGVGDIDGDGGEDLGVLAPGAGGFGAAAFFRHTSPGLASFASGDVPMNIGVPQIPGIAGRGLGGVGDINNDGFPDVLTGDGDQAVKILGAYAISGARIDGASDDFRFAWSDHGARPFVVMDGEIRTYSKIPGLIQAPAGDMGATRSEIIRINTAGTIAFFNHAPAIPESPKSFLILSNGVVSTIENLVTTIEGGAAPNFSSLFLIEMSNSGHLLLGGDGVWVLHEGVLTRTPFQTGLDVNAQGLTLGTRVHQETPLGVWRRGGEFVAIGEGFESAYAVNDMDVVIGVLANTRTIDSPGVLATWHEGFMSVVGAAPESFPVGIGNGFPVWEVRAFDDAGRVLADVVVDQNRSPDRISTFFFEPGEGVQRLSSITHRVTANSFGEWSDGFGSIPSPGFGLSTDGRVLAYSGILTSINEEDVWVLRADSPTASIAAGGVHYFAGVNQFGEVVLFSREGDVTGGRRVSSRLVEPNNQNLVLFTTPGVNDSVYLVVADAGRMDLYVNGANPTDIHFETRPAEQTAIVQDLTVLTNSSGAVHLAGLDTNGDMVLYFVADPINAGTNGAWIFDNLTKTHLDARGEATPAFVSNITGFATPWGTMHFAGLDAQGNVQVVWWGPDSPLWRVTDLTTGAEGARAMQGNVSAFVTPWSTLHVNGTDEEGRTVALWWAPEFGGTWRVDQLASDVALKLNPGTLTSYVTSWGGLNVVGRDAVNGRATSYWWSPESNVWTVEVLQVEVGVQGPTLAGPVSANASAEGILDLFSRGLDGHATRIWWQPGDAGVWTLEDLTEMA